MHFEGLSYVDRYFKGDNESVKYCIWYFIFMGRIHAPAVSMMPPYGIHTIFGHHGIIPHIYCVYLYIVSTGCQFLPFKMDEEDYPPPTHSTLRRIPHFLLVRDRTLSCNCHQIHPHMNTLILMQEIDRCFLENYFQKLFRITCYRSWQLEEPDWCGIRTTC